MNTASRASDQRAAENRLARPDAEDWSEPPRDSDTDTDD